MFDIQSKSSVRALFKYKLLLCYHFEFFTQYTDNAIIFLIIYYKHHQLIKMGGIYLLLNRDDF